MVTNQEQTEWAVFGPSFWDENQLVAKAVDGCWIYPGRGFDPKSGQHYYLRLEKRISQRTQRPYYIGYPRHGSVAEPPPEFKQLLDRIENLEHEIEQVKVKNGDLREQVIGLKTENSHLEDEVMALRIRLAMQEDRPSVGDESLRLNRQTIEMLLKNCSLQDLLGPHSGEKQKRIYRQIMLLIHPDKTRDFGEKTVLILEELVKAINARYRSQ